MALTYALLVAVVGLALACDWRWFVVAARELGCSLTFRNVSLATLQLLVYIGVLALLSEALPGWVYPGTIPADGSKRIHYKCNGLAVLGSTVAIWAALGSGLGAWTWSYLADNVGAFLAAANLLAWSLATLLLLRQRWRSRASASTGPSQRSWLRDFILGAELNPHLGRFELKFFWLRPSMIGWMLLNLSIAAKQWHALGRVTTRMLLTQLIMNGYILDYFWHESKMTTTWDIVAEHFGLMLIWGDLVFIPFVFSTPAWCLVHDQRRMSVGLLLGTLITVVLGGWIFRSANSQKDAFKRDSQRPVSSWFVSWSRGIPRWHRLERETSQTGVTHGTATKAVNRTFGGGRLLASGWWSVARHSNYLGDLLLALAFSMPTLGGAYRFVAFIYFFYLLLLLIHRSQRDEARCRQKYGAAWRAYCEAVPYVLLPGVW